MKPSPQKKKKEREKAKKMRNWDSGVGEMVVRQLTAFTGLAEDPGHTWQVIYSYLYV